MDRKMHHKQQTRRQIILPAVFIFLLLIAFAAGMIYLGRLHPVGMRMAADYVLATILLPLILINLMFFALTILLIRLVVDWIRELPGYTDLANEKMQMVGPKVKETLDKLTDPLMTLESKFKAITDILFRRKY